MLIIVFIILLIIITFYARAVYLSAVTKGVKIEHYSHPQSALLIIDAQTDTLMMPQYKNKVEIMRNINTAITYAGNAGLEIIHINQLYSKNPVDSILSGGRYKSGKPGSALTNQLRLPAKTVFNKQRSDAFSAKEFENYLIANQIDTLYLIGADASACIYKTALGGINRGYHIHILKDSVFSPSPRILLQLLREYPSKGIQVSDLTALKNLSPN